MLDILNAIEQGTFDAGRGMIHGRPAWAWAMEAGDAKAMEVAIDQSLVVQGHDACGRSFLMACLDEGLPLGIVLLGLSKSSDEWWIPGPDGRDVFNHPRLDVSMANTIGQRLWAHGLWRRVHEYFGGWPWRLTSSRATRMLASWIPGNG